MKKVILLLLPAFLIFSCTLTARDIKKVSPVKKIIKVLSNPTDQFRSFQTGDWSSIATWESSPDGTTWSGATLTPTSLAAAISIRNLHTVTISSDQDMDEVSIENGGILLHTGGILTVNNNASGDDINVQGGGIFTLAFANNPPSFASGATAFISPNGILRVNAGGLTAAAPAAGVNASNFIYSDASVLEYALNFTAFSTAGVTYFPNVNTSTIPVFRITGNVGSVGGATATVVNGLFEVNGSVTFQNSGTKTFRNGIIGSGTLSSDAACGKFIINGTTASLGGVGTLTVPSTNGMDIGNNTTVTMTSDKSVTGNIALLTNALVMLGTYNLTMTGNISGGSSTSHIVTSSSGKLVLNNITGATPRIFPIGGNTTTISPLAIFNGLGINYGARVEIGINPSIRFPIAAVNRTWVVNASAMPGSAVNVNFFYTTSDGNALFNYFPATVEQGFYTGVWNVINSGLTQFGASPNFQVTTTVNVFAANTDAPMVIANIPAILEPNNFVQLTAQKQNEKALLSWTVLYHPLVDHFIVERSANGNTYDSIAGLAAADLSFTDLQPLPGYNYYRIRSVEKNGKTTYSNVAVIINAAKGFELISITPNPIVNGSFKLGASAAQKMQADILITDMQGRLLQKQTVVLVGGSNTLTMDVSKLARGTYHVYANTIDGRSRAMRFVIQ